MGPAVVKAPPAPVINISDNEADSPVGSDGEEAVSAVKSRTRMAAQLAGINIVNTRRARFAQKYGRLTPEQTLGMCPFAISVNSAAYIGHVALLSKGWRSAIYDHFAPPKIITDRHGRVQFNRVGFLGEVCIFSLLLLWHSRTSVLSCMVVEVC